MTLRWEIEQTERELREQQESLRLRCHAYFNGGRNGHEILAVEKKIKELELDLSRLKAAERHGTTALQRIIGKLFG